VRGTLGGWVDRVLVVVGWGCGRDRRGLGRVFAVAGTTGVLVGPVGGRVKERWC